MPDTVLWLINYIINIRNDNERKVLERNTEPAVPSREVGQGQLAKEMPVLLQRIHDLQKKASLPILWEYFLLRLFRFLLQWTIPKSDQRKIS